MSLEEVAKRARVSTATVSRVMNDAGVVKASTRARVMKAAADLNYHPNLHARTLAGGKSRTIGIIVSNLENPFFLDIFRSMEVLAHRRGFELLVANTGYNSEQLVKSIRLMIGRRVAGLAAIVSEMEPALIEELSRSRFPVVFYDVGTAKRNITNIRVNYRKGMKTAVSYLHSLGHRRIGFIGHHSTLTPINDRVQALIAMAPEYSPRLEVRCVADADGLDGGRRAASELLRTGFRPTAIMCVNDFMALGVMRELHERGLQVPQDVSVTGFDNIKLSEFSQPPLTTVHIPRDTIGAVAFESLVCNTVEISPFGREVTIDPELVVRESTGPARERDTEAPAAGRR